MLSSLLVLCSVMLVLHSKSASLFPLKSSAASGREKQIGVPAISDGIKVNVGNCIPTLGISWYFQIIRFLMLLVKTVISFPCETQRSFAKHKGLL